MRTTIHLVWLLVLFGSASCSTETRTVDSCGDGFVDPGEDCDGSALGGASCTSLGFYKADGVLACTAACAWDTTDCDTARCGDTIIQPDREDCEGANLAGETCISLGYERGTLGCTATCSFDRTGCEGAGRCGDGQIQEPEECDGNSLGGQTCAGLGYYTGSLACGDDCQFDLGSCDHECGDGTVDVAHQEVCDGTNLNGKTCETLGYYGAGTLACGPDCRSFDEAGCEAEGFCGDDLAQVSEGEVCDGSDLDGQTCLTLGYHGGALACDEGCALDPADCITEGRCGDGSVQTGYGEACDGADLDGQTCVSLGYHGGALACTAGCDLDPADCLTEGRCGDGSVQTGYGESCDGADLDGQTCGTQGFGSGTLACDAAGGFVTAGCSLNYESPNLGTMLHVPAGTFQRDAVATNLSVVSAFRMSRYEVTRAQWEAVTGWADPSAGNFSGGMDDPVQMVNWYDAITFCNKLSLLEGLTPVYSVSGVDFSSLTYAQIPEVSDPTWNAVTANWSADGYRLPTETELKWAAMGADTGNPGATNTTGWAKAFAGSTGTNAVGDYAVFGYGTSETGRTTAQRSNPVGSRLGNELGFFDLSGNILEWAWDGYDSYPTGTLTDYRGAASGIYRSTFGGYWDFGASFCALAFRGNNTPNARGYMYGFRVVRR